MLAGCLWRPADVGLDVGTVQATLLPQLLLAEVVAQRQSRRDASLRGLRMGSGTPQHGTDTVAQACAAALRSPNCAVLAVQGVQVAMHDAGQAAQRPPSQSRQQSDACLYFHLVHASTARSSASRSSGDHAPKSLPAVFIQLSSSDVGDAQSDDDACMTAAPGEPATGTQHAPPPPRASSSLRRNISRLSSLVPGRRSLQQRATAQPEPREAVPREQEARGRPAQASPVTCAGSPSPRSAAQAGPQPSGAEPPRLCKPAHHKTCCEARLSGWQVNLSHALCFKLAEVQARAALQQATSDQARPAGCDGTAERCGPYASVMLTLHAPEAALNQVGAAQSLQAATRMLESALQQSAAERCQKQAEGSSGQISATSIACSETPVSCAPAASQTPAVPVPKLCCPAHCAVRSDQTHPAQLPLSWHCELAVTEAACALLTHDMQLTACSCDSWQLAPECPHRVAGDELALRMRSCKVSSQRTAAQRTGACTALQGGMCATLTPGIAASSAPCNRGSNCSGDEPGHRARQGGDADKGADECDAPQSPVTSGTAEVPQRPAGFEAEQSVHSSVVLCSSPEVRAMLLRGRLIGHRQYSICSLTCSGRSQYRVFAVVTCLMPRRCDGVAPLCFGDCVQQASIPWWRRCVRMQCCARLSADLLNARSHDEAHFDVLHSM